MNGLLCFLLGHVYNGERVWKLDHGTHETIVSLRRPCLCCNGFREWTAVDDETGSRFVWVKAEDLVGREQRAGRPLWSGRF